MDTEEPKCCPAFPRKIVFPWENEEDVQHICGNFGHPPPPIGCWNCEEDLPAIVDQKFCSRKCKEEY